MRLAFVTGSRSEWPLIEPVLRAARAHETLDARLLVAGSHLSRREGRTVDAIREAGYEPDAGIEPAEGARAPADIARTTGRMMAGFADAFVAMPPDWVVVAGDRYEAFAAAGAASILGLPIAHIAGGETDVATNYDGNLRNAISKLAHAHFVAHEQAATRVRALGEEPWRIHVTGLPSLDGIEERAATRAELVAQGLIPQRAPFILASYFPVTMQAQESRQLLDMWLESLNRLDVHKLIIRANADAGANDYAAAIDAWAEETKDATIVASLTPSLYLAALRETACYVGNSSCGLIEAPLLGTPVVMLGTRQEGRLAGPHAVVLRSPTVDELVAAVQAQVAHGPYRGLTSPWGDGAASGRICDALASMRSLPELLIKRLVHSAGASASATAPRRDVKTAARIEPSVAVQLLKHEAIV